MGIVRFHENEHRIPGPYDGVVSVLVDDGTYEMLGFRALPNPSRAEYRSVYNRLESEAEGFLVRKKHDRAK